MYKNRWFVYALLGIVFGIVDFYYQGLVQGIGNNALLIFMVLVIWVVIVIPVAINEAKITRSAWKAALASTFTWVLSVISYYLFMMVKLMFIGEPGRPELHITSRTDPYYWDSIKSVMQYDILGGIAEWVLVAIFGGTVIGYLIGLIYLKTKPKKLDVQ